jgi:hypothetical protein
MKIFVSAVTFALLAFGPAFADTCIVTDPTGTPLNIRATPNGQIVGTLVNGTQVTVSDVAFDRQGNAWAYIGIGWVYRQYITCY